MYIKRDLEDKIEKYLAAPEIIAVVGPRQAGKTTLLKQVYSTIKKSSVFLSFEDRGKLNLFNQNIKDFYALYLKDKKYVFIDEFQYAKEGGKNLKFLYDTHKIKILISGSSALDLTHQAIKYLVGRIFVFHLYPFSFKEFLLAKDKTLCLNLFSSLQKKLRKVIHGKQKQLPSIAPELTKKLQKYYKEYLVFGGYPRVALAKDFEEKKEVLKNIFNIYFLREIREILRLDTDAALDRLIKLLALQVGGQISYNDLSQGTGLNHKKLLKHLQILEKTFIAKQIKPFFTNKRLEITKAPKLFFYDNGFRNAAINSLQNYDERSDQGMLNENFVASALILQDAILNYWRTKSNAEIDFVVKTGQGMFALEVKASLSSMKTERAYYSFKEKYHPQTIAVVSPNYYSAKTRKGILFLPAYFL